MLELNKWFFVHLANFLILLFLLDRILFRPLLGLLKEREDRTKGSLENAKAMDNERNDLLREIETKLSAGRNKARDIFDGVSQEGLAEQRKSLDEATAQAAKLSDQARVKLEAETKKAKEKLQREVESFSKIIVEKMIGV
jgi:F-type H+-transporting ATPase subunit b